MTVSLAAQWRELGIHPDAVLGHSHGEIAAAYVAGGLSLRDAAKVITLRSRAIRAIAGDGGMVLIRGPPNGFSGSSSRGINRFPWPHMTVRLRPSSPGTQRRWTSSWPDASGTDVPAARLPVGYTSHSTQVEPLRETLRETLSGLRPRTGDIAFISGVTGAGLDTSILDGDYWFANLRQPVLFEQAVRWSYEHGYRAFVEASPYPVLMEGIQESLRQYGPERGKSIRAAVLPTGG